MLSASSYNKAPSLFAALVFDGYVFGSPANTDQIVKDTV